MKDLIKNIYTWLIMGALVCVILLSAAAMNRDEDERDKRTEEGEHTFLTFTPGTISQIYRDDWRVRPRKISGELSLPRGDGPFPGVVLSHMGGADQGAWNPLPEHLMELGYAALTFDFRGHGKSQGELDPPSAALGRGRCIRHRNFSGDQGSRETPVVHSQRPGCC